MKPLKAFPFPLNIGTDICHISRIYRILENPPRGRRFVDRILAPEERSTASSRLRPLLSPAAESPSRSESGSFAAVNGTAVPRDQELWKTAAFIAGRFAAKEAAIKAHSHRRLTFHDIIIERRGHDGEPRLGSGPPVARIRGLSSSSGESGGEGKEGEEEDTSAMISISHDGEYATAVCMGYDPSVMEGKSK